MSEDILHRIRVNSRNPDLEANEEMHNQALLLIEDMCYLMCGSLLFRLGMPAPDRGVNDAFNRELERERAILAAKNKDVNDLNFIIQNQIVGTLHSFKSIDCVTNEDEAINYPTEFLNSLDVPGLPPHNLQLKAGSVVIMLRNLNQPKLCNGTRLVIRKLMSNVIHATILKGKCKD